MEQTGQEPLKQADEFDPCECDLSTPVHKLLVGFLSDL